MKLRKAKDYLKEYYCIDPKYEAYAETDIMLAVHYIDHIAEQLQRPIVIFLGIGTKPCVSSWNRTIRSVSVRQSDASGSRSCHKRWK